MASIDRDAVQEVVRRLKKNPDGVFPEFYELTKRKVFFFILSYLHDEAASEDVMQDTYVLFLQSLGKLSLSLNPLSYLMSIAKNEAIDYLRKLHPSLSLDEEGVDEVIGLEDGPGDESGPLLQAIAHLLTPFEYRVYILHVLGDLKFKEIAKIVRRPIGTLTYTYMNAIQKLQKGLPEQWKS
jgi:RNA polymerase sigma-70 factor, ECF subfamily